MSTRHIYWLPQRGCHTAFSLLEILVVIAVMAILTALLVAMAAPRAFDIYQQSKCASNLRQIGMGLHLYAIDNDGRMPNQLPGGQGNPTWHYYLQDYLDWGSGGAASSLGNCPTHPRKSNLSNFNFKRSYAMNASYTPSFWQSRLVQHPEKAFLVGENRPDSETRRITPGDIGYNHRDKANFLFLDGHVAALSEAQVPASADRRQPHYILFWRPLEYSD